MRPYDPLRRRGQFAWVQRRGKRRAGPFLTCIVCAGRRRTRIGLTVSTEVGNAVVRNRLRRRLKAILDRYPLAVPPFRDVVFIARRGAGEIAFVDLVAEVERTFGPPA